MSFKRLQREALRCKALSCIDRYLSLSDKHRLSVGIYRNGEMYILESQYNDCDYRYDIGSISKTVTAHLILSLADKGYINLQNTVDKYLKLKKGNYPTVYELLTHTAGYHHLTPIEITVPNLLMHGYARKNVYEKCTAKTVISCLQRRRNHKKGKAYGYSDFAYAILALVAESVTYSPFSKLFEDFVQNILGLKSTALQFDTRTPEAVLKNRTVQFWKWHKNNPYVSAGGLVSTIGDMLRYVALQIESEDTYITDAHRVCTASMLPKKNIAMCIGWHTYKKSNQLWHVGGVGTFRSSVIINKQKSFGVAILGNAKGVSSANVHYLAKMLYSEFKLKKIDFTMGEENDTDNWNNGRR